MHQAFLFAVAQNWLVSVACKKQTNKHWQNKLSVILIKAVKYKQLFSRENRALQCEGTGYEST